MGNEFGICGGDFHSVLLLIMDFEIDVLYF